MNARKFVGCRSIGLVWLVWSILMGFVRAASASGCVDGGISPRQAQKFSLTQAACGLEIVGSARQVQDHAQQLSLYSEGLASSSIIDSVGPAIPSGVEARVAKEGPTWGRPSPSQKAQIEGSAKSNKFARVQRALQVAPQVDEVARQYQIDPLFLHSIAHVESRHNPGAVSRVGAMGMMQVMPATARRFGVQVPSSLHDVETNLAVSAAYLKILQRRFGNDLRLVLAGYNAGEGAVEKYGRRVPPYKETQNYVVEVLEHYSYLQSVAAQLGGGSRP